MCQTEEAVTNGTSNGIDQVKEIEDAYQAKLLEQKQRLRIAVWRDFVFLALGGVALQIVSYVETHAADADIRGAILDAAQGGGSNGDSIVDAGFILTAPLHRFLADNRDWNDFLALINSLVLIVPTIYAAQVTMWQGDYTLAFRLVATQLFRSFCGWFTYLPPAKEFLMSVYDFPEVAQCLFKDCNNVAEQPVLPFVSFFSGHVATCVIAANHMYVGGFVKSALLFHVFNVFQIIRLLATRGHYSIDIIIGWCVAIYVSNPAERLGRYYSRGMSFHEMLMPESAAYAFETMTGIRGQDRHTSIVVSDTTARIAAEVASNFAKRSLQDLRDDLAEVGLHMNEIKELRRNDLVRLLELTQLKIEELRREAKAFDVKLTDGMSRGEIILSVMRKMKQVIQDKLLGKSDHGETSNVQGASGTAENGDSAKKVKDV